MTPRLSRTGRIHYPTAYRGLMDHFVFTVFPRLRSTPSVIRWLGVCHAVQGRTPARRHMDNSHIIFHRADKDT
jgi:hypothetical protein